MAAETLLEAKFEASRQLATQLIEQGAPLLAAYWDFNDEAERWALVLVPISPSEERRLIKQATELLSNAPYRPAFSIFDLLIDGRQIERARALGAYIRVKPYIGRRIDTTFTGRQYFESVIPVYLPPELLTHLRVA